MEVKDRFLNFPIVLLKGFLEDHKRCLDRIFYYSVYKVVYSEESVFEDLDEFKNEFKIKIPPQSVVRIQKEGKELFDSCYGMGYPWTGIHIGTYIDFRKERDEFDLVCLLLFIALKSIIQVKPFAKTYDHVILSRMAGFGRVEKATIPERVHYWMEQKSRRRTKVFAVLEKWKVVKAYNARGTWFSINKLNQVELELAILKKKEEQSMKKSNEKKKLAKAEALKRFKEEKERKRDP